MLFLLQFLLLPWLCQALTALPPVDWTFDSRPSTFTFPRRHVTIYLQSSAASVRDTDGLTLIPPSALEFAHTFATDLKSTFPDLKSVCVEEVDENPGTGIYLSLDPNTDQYTYESGVKTSEGYTITIEEDVINIAGAGARGIWWGTRALLQELVLVRGTKDSRTLKLKTGKAKDSPAYPTRGFMLDAGRKWYSADVSFFSLSFFSPFFFPLSPTVESRCKHLEAGTCVFQTHTYS